jgi:hypothetical protein
MYLPWGNCLDILAISIIICTKEDFAKVAIIVQIIQFPHLNKPNFKRLCHYCATKNGTFGHKNVVCKKYHFAHHIDFQLVTSQKDA